MKTKFLIMMMIFGAGLHWAPLVYGQGADAETKKGRRFDARIANLSPEERGKLSAARAQAMKDPAVEAAKRKLRQARIEFRDAVHAAMLKADPSIQPILQKLPKGGD